MLMKNLFIYKIYIREWYNLKQCLTIVWNVVISCCLCSRQALTLQKIKIVFKCISFL